MSEQKKESKKRKHKKRRPFLKLLIFIILVVGSIVLLNSNLFNVADFEITGNEYYTVSQVKELCGINTGKNIIFETKLKPARNKLLESPYVKIAKLSKKLPGTIVIDIEERTEFAAIPFGEQYIIIDHEGLILRISDNDAELPVIAGLTVVTSIPGDPLNVDQSYILEKCINLLSEVEKIDFYFERIDVSSLSVKAYIYYDQFCCEGTIDNILENLASIKVMVASYYQEDVTHGKIIVGTNNYLVYQP